MSSKRRHRPVVVTEPTSLENNSSNLEDAEATVDTEANFTVNGDVEVEDSSRIRKTHGQTRMSDIWNLPKGHRIVVEFNRSNQPIKVGSTILGNFLGAVGRTSNLCPLNYDDWRKVPKIYKDEVWGILKTKFTLLDKNRKWCLSSLSRRWGGYKCHLRGSYVSKYDTENECLKHKPNNIPKDQWAGIVSFWYSTEGMRRSARNTKIRKKQKFTHSGGRKSLARISYEMKEKLGRDPTRVEVYLEAHKRKDGSYLTEECAKIAEKFKAYMETNGNDVEAVSSQVEMFEQILGKEHSGRVRGMGLGPTPTEVLKMKSHRFARVEINSGTDIEDHQTAEGRSRLTKLELEVANMRSDMKKILSILEQSSGMQVGGTSGTSLESS